MAFLTTGAPASYEYLHGPYGDIEYKGMVVGFAWVDPAKKRLVRKLYVYYQCDDTGGESPAATWSYDAETYYLLTYGPQLGPGDKLGLYLAIYYLAAQWQDV